MELNPAGAAPQEEQAHPEDVPVPDDADMHEAPEQAEESCEAAAERAAEETAPGRRLRRRTSEEPDGMTTINEEMPAWFKAALADSLTTFGKHMDTKQTMMDTRITEAEARSRELQDFARAS